MSEQVAWRYRLANVPDSFQQRWIYLDHPELARSVIEARSGEGGPLYEVEALRILPEPPKEKQ
jgi:hypothetical protein